MVPEENFGSDHQPWSQLFVDNSSVISHQDLSTTGGSSWQGPSYRSAQYISGSINISVESNPTNSGTSFDESSLITGVNSSQYGGSFLKGPSFTCVESPASISGSSTVHQSSAQEPQFSVTAHQGSVPPMMMFKNPRLVTMQEDSRLPSNPSLWQAMQSKCYNDRVIASRMLRQQQNPHQLQQNPYQQQQNPHQLQQNPLQQQQNPYQQLFHTDVQPQQAANTVKNAGLAVRRLTSYLHYQRHRPPDNNIFYWRSFVRHYYSPQVKRKTCFSKYAHSGNHVVHVKPWKCEICGCTPAKGFVETFDVLPRMHQLYFNSSGVVDELMFLDFPTEIKLPDGSLMVCYEKAVQESIYKHCRVVHEGKLRVIFTAQLQIIYWEFCVQHHEVLLSRRLIASQVNDFMKDATRCKSNDDANGHDRVQEQNLPSNGNRIKGRAVYIFSSMPTSYNEVSQILRYGTCGNGVEDAGRKVAAMVEQPHVSDLGLSKHIVLSLQVSEVLNSMKDLMDFSLNNNTSPIETLKRYGRKCADGKLEKREMECRSSMPQTAGLSEHRKFPAQNVHLTGKTNHTFQMDNYMFQTQVNNKKATYNSLKPPVAEQMMPDRYPSPYNKAHQNPIASAQSSFGPSSARISSNVEQFMLNDLLAHMRREGTQQAQRKNSREVLHGGAQKKIRLGCSLVNNELETGHTQILDCKSGNGKGLNSSSSSNSSRMFPNCNFLKRDTDLDEDDFTSPVQT